MSDNYVRLATTLPCGCKLDRSVVTVPGQQIDLPTTMQILSYCVASHKCPEAKNAT